MAATAAHPDISTDPSTLDAWLKRLPADPSAAFGALREQVQGLASSPIAASERFGMLERLRSRAVQLLPELRSRYFGKPLPFDDGEQKAWADCVGVWEAFYFSYALCTESDGEAARAATVSQRALDCLGRAIREYSFAYRGVPSALWKELNSCYLSAEGCGIGALTLDDAEQPGTPASCKRAYLMAVLHDSASLYSLSARQMQGLEQLLPAWAALADLTTECASDAARCALAIDLASDGAARLARTLQPVDSLRYLDTSQLAQKLRELAAAVRAGTPPLELAPLRTLDRPATERLLTHLYIQWCSAGTGRVDARRDAPRRAQLALHMHAIHFQISGRAFRQPGLRYTREEESDLVTFGHITERTEQRLLTSRSSALEPWDIVNESTSGFLGMMRKPDLASRIHHGQLIAMRTSSMEPPMLALVQRLKFEPDGGLSIGVRLIRSDVRAVAVRPLGDATLKYERALVVAADETRATPAYLIIPPGRFTLGSTVELHAGQNERIVITSMLDRGVDHDRVAYKAA